MPRERQHLWLSLLLSETFAWRGSETNVKRSISLIDYVDFMNARNATERTQVIAFLHSQGITEIRGVPVETIVRVGR